MNYIAVLKTQNDQQGFSNLSFNQAIELLNELISKSNEQIEEALILEDTSFYGKLVASVRIIR